MNEGDLVLTPIPQADGQIKNRPVAILRKMPPYNDLLVCGVSTQLQQLVPDFDELVALKDPDFTTSGLLKSSVIRLSFLAIVPNKAVVGSIGSIAPERHRRLLCRLSAYLVQNLK
ncbi:MAG: transcriptional regulator [Candidatus Ozemobacteraceae bacterium]